MKLFSNSAKGLSRTSYILDRKESMSSSNKTKQPEISKNEVKLLFFDNSEKDLLQLK